MGSGQSHFLNTPERYATSSPSNDSSNQWRSYDYVIVGGGESIHRTAGCVLASRLSEDPATTVLLVEAGKGRAYTLYTHTRHWNSPQEHMYGREIYCPRGKILGGSSAINALIYQHCAQEDFDEWVGLGATGWSYGDLKPYFSKAENYSPNTLFSDVRSEDRGRTGPWKIRHGVSSDVNKIVIQTVQNLGVPYNPDICTGKSIIGVTDFPGFIDEKGRRSSTATAYLTEDVLSRPNLSVATEIVVEKIVFSSTGGETRAVGLHIRKDKNSPRFAVRASREVIVCAGAIGTPHLLLISGVGPQDELARHGIPVVKELEHVGRNLSDHISCGPLSFRAKKGYTWDHLTRPFPGAMALFKWMLLGKGPMASLASAGAAFIRSDDSNLPYGSKGAEGGLVEDLTSGPNAPDIEIVWAPSLFLNYGFTPVPAGMTGITMGAVALKPKSTGRITLKTNSVWDKPLIDPNYYACETDLNLVVRATRLCLRIARSEPLKSILDLKPHSTNKSDFMWPGDADPDKVTDTELKEWARKNSAPPFHPVSSARMGKSAADSVVGPDLRVHGIQGLRIMDASIFPSQVSGHPCAVIVAMAERAAELINMAPR
ncbi:GMC oxidoreductase [Punctularia strigosozonata HHB-11173 SS5]|uniref:GMC oxidoreductase n=1 Tax=Punctularia strigosozonata (strain HHB-11173) TaxID=741275 RepID=UPI0004418046|nr:GMC oxidoreductase [Punctularia strigosozonata HHB-11173 SS5]EIN09203.1 GMC oxidoreductase [Punctularia strigosozonata HHB-11173 SS5]